MTLKSRLGGHSGSLEMVYYSIDRYDRVPIVTMAVFCIVFEIKEVPTVGTLFTTKKQTANDIYPSPYYVWRVTRLVTDERRTNERAGEWNLHISFSVDLPYRGLLIRAV